MFLLKVSLDPKYLGLVTNGNADTVVLVTYCSTLHSEGAIAFRTDFEK